MEDSVLAGIILLIVVIFVGSAIMAMKYLWNKGKYSRWLCVLLIGALLFEGYRAFFPFDVFFEREFTKITNQEFPVSATIIDKYASYPDIQGDYESCAVIEVSKVEHSMLSDTIEHSANVDIPYFECELDLPEHNKFTKWHVLSEEGGHVTFWGLINEGSLVVIYYSSW